MCLRLASEELSPCSSQAALIHQQKVAYKLVFEASCGTRATTVSPWGWALSVPAIKLELGGQLLWTEGRDPRSSQQPGRTTTQWAPHPHASQLRWSHVGLINTRWPCREQGELHFLGLSFLVLACGVSVPSVACPLCGKNTEDGEEGKRGKGVMAAPDGFYLQRGHGHRAAGWNPGSGRKEVSSATTRVQLRLATSCCCILGQDASEDWWLGR